MLNPERASFIRVMDILGLSAKQIAERINSDIDMPHINVREIEVLMKSDLYQRDRSELIEAFRRQAIRGAVDTLLMANQQAAEFLTDAMTNMTFRPNTRMKAAIEILDRIPQTSKTLRQYIGEAESSIITEEQLNRMTSQVKIDVKALRAIEAGKQEEEQFRENLKNLIDV